MSAKKLLRILEKTQKYDKEFAELSGKETWSPKGKLKASDHKDIDVEYEKESSALPGEETVEKNFNNHLRANNYPSIKVESVSITEKAVKVKFSGGNAKKYDYTFSIKEGRPYISGTNITDYPVYNFNVPVTEEKVAFHNLSWLEPSILREMFGAPERNWPSKVSNFGYDSRIYDAYGNLPKGR
jgi:hypothetical protein